MIAALLKADTAVEPDWRGSVFSGQARRAPAPAPVEAVIRNLSELGRAVTFPIEDEVLGFTPSSSASYSITTNSSGITVSSRAACLLGEPTYYSMNIITSGLFTVPLLSAGYLDAAFFAGAPFASVCTLARTGRAAKGPLTFSREAHERLLELRIMATEDEIAISDASWDDAARYLSSHRAWRDPSIFLLDNGNLRLMWWSADSKEQVGLHFRGGGEVQYVIFVRRSDDPELFRRSAGRDNFRGVERLIDEFGAKRLVS